MVGRAQLAVTVGTTVAGMLVGLVAVSVVGHRPLPGQLMALVGVVGPVELPPPPTPMLEAPHMGVVEAVVGEEPTLP